MCHLNKEVLAVLKHFKTSFGLCIHGNLLVDYWLQVVISYICVMRKNITLFVNETTPEQYCCVYMFYSCGLRDLVYMFYETGLRIKTKIHLRFTVDDGLEDEEVNMRNGRDKGESSSFSSSSSHFSTFYSCVFSRATSSVIHLISFGCKWGSRRGNTDIARAKHI